MRGRVLEKVTCVADPTQTYTLYVPSNYSPQTTWPVIYCFDPGARGRTPVERLQAAAEKYGYIVAGSLNSRNGPWEENAKAIQAMVKDVDSHLAIDRQRVYTAGLSGGARVATQLALLGVAKGVIACSAGFPAMEDGLPVRVPFWFFGTAGIEDMNYHELKTLDGELEDRKAAHRIVFFDGGHEWASVALLTEAVEWLELQAMRTGTRPKDETLIHTFWRARFAAVPVAAGLERWRALKSLAADFKGLVETAEIETEAKKLGAAREVKDALKAERALDAREHTLDAELAGVSQSSLAKKEKFAAELRKKADATDDSAERQMVRRRVASYLAMVRENLRPLFANAEYGEVADMLELATALRPGQSRTLFDLARARAFSRDSKRALEALRQAAAAGLSDATRVESEPAFAKLKSDAAFQEILAVVRANPPEPERGGRGRP